MWHRRPRLPMAKHRSEGEDTRPLFKILEGIRIGIVFTLVAGGFVLIPVLLWSSVSALIHANYFSDRARPVAGVVVSVRETRNCFSYGGCSYAYIPRVRYRMPVTGGVVVRDVDDEFGSPPQLGPRTIYYDPSDPSRVQLDKGYNDDARAAVGGLILWAALPPILGGVALVKRRREHRDRAA
jgi:hypothetical protein